MNQSPQCPACETLSSKLVGKNPTLSLWRCPQCDLVFSFPQPIEVVREKYLHEYDLAEHFAPFTQRKRVLFEHRLSRVPAPRPHANRVCDVGCADGQFLAIAAEQGWQPHGIEMNPPAAARSRERGATVYEGTFERLDDVIPWGTFDLVTCWDAIEHTPTPNEFARRLVRLLKPGGRLVLTTLNHPSLVWHVFGMRWSMVVEDHFTYWNKQSIEWLLHDAGARLVAFETYALGRDFVTVVDRIAKRVRRHSGSVSSGSGAPPSPAASSTGTWDVNPKVLAVESLLNGVFRRYGGGGAFIAQFVRAVD